jgi:hypothetical protein
MPRTLSRKPQQNTRRTAATPREWRTLCRQALERANAVGDRRAKGLELALTTRREQAILRSLGILSELDLDREFSSPLK